MVRKKQLLAEIETLKYNRDRYLEAEGTLQEVGEALFEILPEELKPTKWPNPNLFGGHRYLFNAIFNAAEAVKRAEQTAGDAEWLKIVKRIKGVK